MNIRCRASELDDHLRANFSRLQIQPEQFDSENVGMTVIPGGLHEREEGIHYANFRYTHVIYLERLPVAKVALLALLIQNYLDLHDDTRLSYSLPDVKLEMVALDRNGLIDVDATVEFVDPAWLTPADGGPIVWHGTEFDAGVYDYRIAENLDDVPEHVGKEPEEEA